MLFDWEKRRCLWTRWLGWCTLTCRPLYTSGEVWALVRTRHAFPDPCYGRVDFLFTKQKVPYKAKVEPCIHEQVVRVTRLLAINRDHFLVTCSNTDANLLPTTSLKYLEMPPFCAGSRQVEVGMSPGRAPLRWGV